MPNPLTIPTFYEGKNIFLSGATGFLGKVCLEKILRSLPDVKTIFLLIRTSPGKSPSARLKDEILTSPIFERLHSQYGGKDAFELYASSKLVAIGGDMLAHKNKLGISDSDFNIIAGRGGIDIVFHCAATIDFTERIDRAIDLNILGSISLMEIAAKMPQPRMLVCNRRPGTRPTQGAIPENICSDRRDRNSTSPIQMNIGSAASSQDTLAP